MRQMSTVYRLLATALLAVAAHVALPPAQPNEEQRAVLQQTVKAMLDFDRLPNAEEVIRPFSKTTKAASNYMHKLFRKYQADGAKSGDGNIVRSIGPRLDGAFDKAVTFSLHAIGPTERLVRAELHLGRHSKRRKPTKQRRIHLHCAALQPSGQLELSLLDSGASWLSWDALDALSAALAANDSGGGQLRVRFSRRLRPLDSQRVIRRRAPFLIVHTASKLQLDKTAAISALYTAETQPERARNKRGLSPSLDYFGYRVGSAEKAALPNPETVDLHLRAFQTQGPDLLFTRRELRRQRKKARRRYGKAPYERGNGVFGRQTTDWTMEDPFYAKKITYGDLKDIAKKKNDPTVVLLGGEGVTNGLCTKHPLRIEFKDIGWEHWIIAPSGFSADYCMGRCPFPLQPEVNPTNHAIMQSVINAVGLNPHLPRVCCAPDKMDSLTLLYFDEDDNVVLKNYPKMIVQSCGCL